MGDGGRGRAAARGDGCVQAVEPEGARALLRELVLPSKGFAPFPGIRLPKREMEFIVRGNIKDSEFRGRLVNQYPGTFHPSPLTLHPQRSKTAEHLPEARVESPPMILIGCRNLPPRYATTCIAHIPSMSFTTTTRLSPIVPPPQGEPHPPHPRYRLFLNPHPSL